jgi:quercetin dioxygenase-like cupin family protein
MTEHPEDSSCELPGASPPDGSRYRAYDGSTWDGVTPQVYKLGGSPVPGGAWRDIVRHTLVSGADEAMAFQLRYFEIGPDGYSSLEKHRHVHAVIILRGTGRVVVGREVFDVAPFDLVYVPPNVPHQFVNSGSEPFGFLCPVDADRDPPQPLTPEELRQLLGHPKVRAVVRIGQAAEPRIDLTVRSP